MGTKQLHANPIKDSMLANYFIPIDYEPHRKGLAPRYDLLKEAKQARTLRSYGRFSEAYYHLVECRATVLSHPETFDPGETSLLLDRIDSLRKECQDAIEQSPN